MTQTHCDRVLEALRGGPKTHHELYALGVIAHSRIADLRKRGYEIEQRREGENYIYRLLGPLPQPAGDSIGQSDGGHGPRRRRERAGQARRPEARQAGVDSASAVAVPLQPRQLSFSEAA